MAFGFQKQQINSPTFSVNFISRQNFLLIDS